MSVLYIWIFFLKTTVLVILKDFPESKSKSDLGAWFMIQPNISAEKIHQCEFLSKKATQKHTFCGSRTSSLEAMEPSRILQEKLRASQVPAG